MNNQVLRVIFQCSEIYYQVEVYSRNEYFYNCSEQVQKGFTSFRFYFRYLSLSH